MTEESLRPVLLEDGERRRLAAEARSAGDFTFMGNHVRIGGAPPAPLERFTAMLDRFTRTGGGGAPDLAILYRLVPETGELTVVVDGEAFRLRHPEIAETAWNCLLFFVYSRIRSHLLFHAGCVSRGSGAVLLPADSGMGKTTLASRLARDGWGFLSDELAPLNLLTGMVDPVPLRIGLRPGVSLDGLDGLAGEEIDWRGDFKKLVEIEELAGSAPAGPAPPRAVVFLTCTPPGEVRTPKKYPRRLRVTVTGAAGRLRPLLAGEAGVGVAGEEEVEGLPAFHLAVADPAAFLPRLKGLVAAAGTEIAGLKYENLEGIDFSRPPRLHGITAAAGVVELVKKMPSAHKGHVVKAVFDGKLSRLIAALAARLGGVRFYRLAPGRLDDMVRILEDLIG